MTHENKSKKNPKKRVFEHAKLNLAKLNPIKLQEDFNAVAEWLESMNSVCNMKKRKTEVMLFGTTHTKKHVIIQYRFKKLSSTTSYKYLGVTLDLFR